MGRHVSFAQPSGRPHISNAPIRQHGESSAPSLLTRAADVVAAVVRPRPAKIVAGPLDRLIAERSAAQTRLVQTHLDIEKGREPIDDARELDRAADRAHRAAALERDGAKRRLLEIAANDADAAADSAWRLAEPAVEAERQSRIDPGGGIEAYDERLLEAERAVDRAAAAVNAAAQSAVFVAEVETHLVTLHDAAIAYNAALPIVLAALKVLDSGPIQQHMREMFTELQSPEPEHIKDLASQMGDRVSALAQTPRFGWLNDRLRELQSPSEEANDE